MQIARRVTDSLNDYLKHGQISRKAYSGDTVSTDIRHIRTCSEFYPAHEEHQKYLENNPKGYCNHRIRFKEWPKEWDTSPVNNAVDTNTPANVS